jgi:hypothetical protein
MSDGRHFHAAWTEQTSRQLPSISAGVGPAMLTEPSGLIHAAVTGRDVTLCERDVAFIDDPPLPWALLVNAPGRCPRCVEQSGGRWG